MKTEAKQAFQCGFALNESELRRLHDVLMQQIKRTAVGDDVHTSYELKFRNGAVAYPLSVDDVLSQENFGSGSIVRLNMGVSGAGDESANRIRVEFNNVDEEASVESIKYTIFGDDRDWVFVTSSQIEERIGKLRLFVPNQLMGRKHRFWCL